MRRLLIALPVSLSLITGCYKSGGAADATDDETLDDKPPSADISQQMGTDSEMPESSAGSVWPNDIESGFATDTTNAISTNSSIAFSTDTVSPAQETEWATAVEEVWPSDTAPLCGNGVLDRGEACDDGDTSDEGGCNADCTEVIPTFGEPSRPLTICGDGMYGAAESCDDGNIEDGDGCSSVCQIELGYQCVGMPSDCFEVVCGNGVVEGGETCDDGNTLPFDGCSPSCLIEPLCDGGSGCATVCGNGIRLGTEACDDGNLSSGDGCSSTCEIEEGYRCEPRVVDERTLSLPMLLRDFQEQHEDFLFFDDADLDSIPEKPTAGLVERALSSDKKPVFALTEASSDAEWREHGFIWSQGSFDTWFRNMDDKAATVSTRLNLYDPDRIGVYVNRYGADFLWKRLDVEYLGNPVFFPMDSDGVTPEASYGVARIPPTYFGLPENASVDDPGCVLGEGCNPCWPVECVIEDNLCAPEAEGITWYDCYSDAPLHNYHFTSQMGFWFEHTQDASYTIAFTGDDDLWVFLNSALILDAGGIHRPFAESVTLNADMGLEAGKVYEVMIFHAKRQTHFSTFKLTLQGFDNTTSALSSSRSVCRTWCGNGIMDGREECDDGENKGGYGMCAPGCVLDGYCGDGVVQEEYGENCDDGNFRDDDDCPSSCRIMMLP